MQTAHLDNIGGHIDFDEISMHANCAFRQYWRHIDFDEISNHYRSDSMQSTVGNFKLRFIAKMSERIIFVQL